LRIAEAMRRIRTRTADTFVLSDFDCVLRCPAPRSCRRYWQSVTRVTLNPNMFSYNDVPLDLRLDTPTTMLCEVIHNEKIIHGDVRVDPATARCCSSRLCHGSGFA
jgi:hypothetical protein